MTVGPENVSKVRGFFGDDTSAGTAENHCRRVAGNPEYTVGTHQHSQVKPHAIRVFNAPANFPCVFFCWPSDFTGRFGNSQGSTKSAKSLITNPAVLGSDAIERDGL